MDIEITAPSSELGLALQEELRAGGSRRGAAGGRTLVNIASQSPNTLLHDGHAWKRHTPARIVADTRAALDSPAGRAADFVVHASYAFLRAAEAGARVGDRLQPILDAALEAERLVLDSPTAACVIRLGYLYGPRSRDLRAFRRSFRIGRLYWAGPRSALHDYLHHTDAAAGLLRAAGARPAGRILHLTDGTPASFSAFMDQFARLVGNPLPLHLPAIARRPAHLVVAEEHMQMAELGVTGPALPTLPGFKPRFPDYRSGLAEVIAAWR